MDHQTAIISHYCENCRENICSQIGNKHKNHDLTKIKNLIDNISNYETIIMEKNKKLMKIIEFNSAIISICKNANNYLYSKSLINIGKEYNREKVRDSNDFKLLFNDYNNEIINSDEIIEKIFEDKNVCIKRDEESLILNNKIDDQYSGLISQIKFNQLKHIDLSENNLTNIEFLNDISLPFLEFLNLSHNNICDIEPLGKIRSKNLSFIYLQNNLIEDIGAFLNNKFPFLKILRLEKNPKLNEETRSFKEVKEIYQTQIITDLEIEKIKKKFDIDEDNLNLDLSNKMGGDLILICTFIILTSKSNSEINKLDLRNNNINNPSLLNKIQFDSLTKLDLSVNNIKNLDFLKEMKAKRLEELYLDNNKINDLSQLKNNLGNFPTLKYITLNSNNFDYEIFGNGDIYRALKEKKIKVKYREN